MNRGFNDSRIKHSYREAEKYATRRPSKHKAEMNLVRRAFSSLDGVETVLDAPCGIGRVSLMLDRYGYTVTGVDAGHGALIKANEEMEKHKASCIFLNDDVRHMTFQDASFDAIVCFRFFHHLMSVGAKQHVVEELCRVSNKYVLISYFSPWSITSIKRKAKAHYLNQCSVQRTTSLSELRGYFERCNFELIKDMVQFPFLKTLHLAIFKKIVVHSG